MDIVVIIGCDDTLEVQYILTLTCHTQLLESFHLSDLDLTKRTQASTTSSNRWSLDMESGAPNFILSQIFKLFKTTSFPNGLSYFHLIPFHAIDRAAHATPISLLNTIKGLSMRALGFSSPLVMSAYWWLLRTPVFSTHLDHNGQLLLQWPPCPSSTSVCLSSLHVLISATLACLGWE